MKKFLKLGLTAVLLVSIFSLSQSVWASFQRLSSLKENDSEIAQLKAENEKLKKERAYRESDFYVETTAREKLGLSKDGEIIYLKVAQASASSGKKEKSVANWRSWLELFTN